jgi:hypothetical protein
LLQTSPASILTFSCRMSAVHPCCSYTSLSGHISTCFVSWVGEFTVSLISWWKTLDREEQNEWRVSARMCQYIAEINFIARSEEEETVRRDLSANCGYDRTNKVLGERKREGRVISARASVCLCAFLPKSKLLRRFRHCRTLVCCFVSSPPAGSSYLPNPLSSFKFSRRCTECFVTDNSVSQASRTMTPITQ